MPDCILGEEDRSIVFERVGEGIAKVEGHRTWVGRGASGGTHVVVHLVDWAEATGLDGAGPDEEQLPRYQVSAVSVTAESLSAEWLEPGLALPIVGAAERSREISAVRRAGLLVELGLGSLIWVREGDDAGRLLRLAFDAANRHVRPLQAAYARGERVEAARHLETATLAG
jgi:hypothetical protein